MSAVIDPVTGLPLIGDMSHIDQIPLGVQIVPWNDLKATAKPMRGPIYPDDAWTNYALTMGQNQNNPDQTQTVYTDGNHNLRVNVENYSQFPSGGGGGGGGGGAVAMQSLPYQLALPNGGGFVSSTVLDGLNGSNTIYGATVSYDVDKYQEDAADDTFCDIALVGDSGGFFFLCTFYNNFKTLSDTGHAQQMLYIGFGPGCKLSSAFGLGENIQIRGDRHFTGTQQITAVFYYS